MTEYKLNKYVANTVDNFPRLISFLPFMFTVIIVKWYSCCQCSFALQSVYFTSFLLLLLCLALLWSARCG